MQVKKENKLEVNTPLETFIKNLESLPKSEVSILKRNVGRTIGESRGATTIFFRILPYQFYNHKNEEIIFMISTLYGLNKYKTSGGMGLTMRALKNTLNKNGNDDRESSLDKRMMGLLDSEFDLVDNYKPAAGEMSYRMRQMVKLAASKEIGIDWLQLAKDLISWSYEDKKIKKRWAREYFGRSQANEEEKEQKRR